MHKKSQQFLFWTLQIVGWGIPSLLNGYGKYLSNSDRLTKKYIIIETLLFFILGVFWSTIFRNYIKSFLQSLNTLKKESRKVIIAYFTTSTSYAVSLIGLSYVAYNLVHQKGLDAKNHIMTVSTFLNIFLFILFWALFYISIKTIVNSEKRRVEYLKLQSSLKDSQLNTLKGQINPHFMFNSLNNIRGLMLEDVEKARDMITRLSELLRYSLSKSSDSTIKVKDELEMVHNYIELSYIQFEDRLTYIENLDQDLLNQEIPPMIIQMLIENAIKHGISQQKKGGVVQLDISEEDKNLCIKVANTGQIEKGKSSTKIGLKNISDRLQILYGNNASFNLNETEDQVIAHIKLPL
ncbi:sensor histidine kinase [Tenacibaculum jejuense]|uniref:DEAD/DEAH box helicase-like protein n=1 Tax=Tenacibaculum jejuense TaxID=584609 RepID=A0A238U4J2_9FLAO|nr:histidine kinase [Tenacibaculum jejuense]SNR13946.1 DEAD/DEAH box helicase-like protein [Tenacibaculum jejuense]